MDRFLTKETEEINETKRKDVDTWGKTNKRIPDTDKSHMCMYKYLYTYVRKILHVIIPLT